MDKLKLRIFKWTEKKTASIRGGRERRRSSRTQRNVRRSGRSSGRRARNKHGLVVQYGQTRQDKTSARLQAVRSTLHSI